MKNSFRRETPSETFCHGPPVLGHIFIFHMGLFEGTSSSASDSLGHWWFSQLADRHSTPKLSTWIPCSTKTSEFFYNQESCTTRIWVGRGHQRESLRRSNPVLEVVGNDQFSWRWNESYTSTKLCQQVFESRGMGCWMITCSDPSKIQLTC